MYVWVSGGKKCLFFGKFGVLYFLVTSVLRFALSPCYQRMMMVSLFQSNISFGYKHINAFSKIVFDALMNIFSLPFSLIPRNVASNEF